MSMTKESRLPRGLGDLRDASHANLAMFYKMTTVCERKKRTLGLGDMLGLEQYH
jgi:hypothetical protein